MRFQWTILAAAAILAPLGRAKAADTRPQPPAFVRSLLASVPPSITHLTAAAGASRVLLFYDKGSMLPPANGPEAAPSRQSYLQTWNGTAWNAPQPFVHVSQALSVGAEIWALSNGGYLVSKDGVTRSALNAQPAWKEPFGCVLAGRPHVFFMDDKTLKETSFDGLRWTEPHPIPGVWDSPAEASPFGSGPQAAVVSGHIHLFMIKRDNGSGQLFDMTDDDAGAASPRQIGPADSFALLEAPDGLHLFYKDMAPPQAGKPSFSNILSAMSEMQSRMMRTYHSVYDGRAWSQPEAIVTGQAMALSAARTDDALWLFGSAMSLIEQIVRRDGRWSQPQTVAGTNTMAAARTSPFFLKMTGIWLLVFVPLISMFGLFIWGVSAMIESGKTVDLQLPGGSVRCASLLRRALAQLADGVVLGIVNLAISSALSRVWASDPAAAMTKFAGHFFAMWLTTMTALMVLYFGYFAVCEALWGKTPGKRLLRIRVVSEDGALCPASSAVVRNVLRILDMFPGYLIGAIAFAAGQKHQRIGDMAAKTVVVLDASPACSPPPAPAL